MLDVRGFGYQQFNHLLDQEIAKGNTPQAVQAIVDGIKNRSICFGIELSRLLFQQVVNVATEAMGKCCFNENKRFVGQGRMKKTETAPVCFQPSAQVWPALDFMD